LAGFAVTFYGRFSGDHRGAEPVTEVAAGSSSYKIEWRGNKVFVQPLDNGSCARAVGWPCNTLDQLPACAEAKPVVPAHESESTAPAKEWKIASVFIQVAVH
jgi:hypothetical protein